MKKVPLVIALLFLMLPVQAATTEVHVVKYASDETTILNETTVDYIWMEENLPITGDGEVHYFHQGPVFEGEWNQVHPNESYNAWNPEEDVNVETRDFGAVKGTDVRDLCELVGGMSPGDEVKIKASDGFNKWFAYENVYNPNSNQGPLVICWYNGEESQGGYEMQGTGYPGPFPNYCNGMRLIFFADTSTNPYGYHVFGNWNMHEYLDEKYWHFYQTPLPSAGGLSVMHVSEIAIYSNTEPPVVSSIVVLPADATLDIEDTQRFNATVHDQSGTEMSNVVVTWASSNETVGLINGTTGLFTAIAAGETTITAENGTVAGTVGVTVSSPAPAATPTPTPTPTPSQSSNPPKVLTTITVSPARATLNVGEVQRFAAAAHDQDHREISGVDFAWTSGNETVGTIDDAGFFTALCAGNTTIMAENGTVTGTAGVTVSSPTPTPASTPTKTPSVDTTPTPSPAPAPAHSSSPPPSATSPASKATPYSSSFKSPGFEALFAIIGISVISCVLKRRKT